MGNNVIVEGDRNKCNLFHDVSEVEQLNAKDSHLLLLYHVSNKGEERFRILFLLRGNARELLDGLARTQERIKFHSIMEAG